MAEAGGPALRVARYATFGTEKLSRPALEALEGRNACLLGNHGVIAAGSHVKRALWLAVGVLPDAPGSRVFQVAFLSGLIAAGIALYCLLLLLFRVVGWHDMQTAMTRSQSPGLRE